MALFKLDDSVTANVDPVQLFFVSVQTVILEYNYHLERRQDERKTAEGKTFSKTNEKGKFGNFRGWTLAWIHLFAHFVRCHLLSTHTVHHQLHHVDIIELDGCIQNSVRDYPECRMETRSESHRILTKRGVDHWREGPLADVSVEIHRWRSTRHMLSSFFQLLRYMADDKRFLRWNESPL